MRDIENRNELMLIMKKFYDLLLSDHRINFFFTETINVNLHLHDHFETLTTFWEQALFYKGGYKKTCSKSIRTFIKKELLLQSISISGFLISIKASTKTFQDLNPNK